MKIICEIVISESKLIGLSRDFWDIFEMNLIELGIVNLPAQSKTQSFTGPTYFGETLNPEAIFLYDFFLSVLSWAPKASEREADLLSFDFIYIVE